MDAETERYLTEVDQERITKEQDEEIMKIKQRQVIVREKSTRHRQLLPKQIIKKLSTLTPL